MTKPATKYLSFLTLSYVMVLAFANWFDPRLVKLFFVNTDAGTLIFPLSFIISDLITEVYGYKHARRAIWTGFLFNCIFLLYGQIVVHLPSPDYYKPNVIFNQLLHADTRIIIASFISYLIAEPVNSFIMAKLKIKTTGKYLSLRFVTSTFFASACDSAIFGVIAFYAVIGDHNLAILIVSMWLIKVAIELAILPISTNLAKKLKRLEQLDIYDQGTNFTIFSLESNYMPQNNKFVEQT